MPNGIKEKRQKESLIHWQEDQGRNGGKDSRLRILLHNASSSSPMKPSISKDIYTNWHSTKSNQKPVKDNWSVKSRNTVKDIISVKHHSIVKHQKSVKHQCSEESQSSVKLHRHVHTRELLVSFQTTLTLLGSLQRPCLREYPHDIKGIP
jgi:hypothetical protein